MAEPQNPEPENLDPSSPHGGTREPAALSSDGSFSAIDKGMLYELHMLLRTNREHGKGEFQCRYPKCVPQICKRYHDVTKVNTHMANHHGWVKLYPKLKGHLPSEIKNWKVYYAQWMKYMAQYVPEEAEKVHVPARKRARKCKIGDVFKKRVTFEEGLASEMPSEVHVPAKKYMAQDVPEEAEKVHVPARKRARKCKIGDVFKKRVTFKEGLASEMPSEVHVPAKKAKANEVTIQRVQSLLNNMSVGLTEMQADLKSVKDLLSAAMDTEKASQDQHKIPGNEKGHGDNSGHVGHSGHVHAGDACHAGDANNAGHGGDGPFDGYTGGYAGGYAGHGYAGGRGPFHGYAGHGYAGGRCPFDDYAGGYDGGYAGHGYAGGKGPYAGPFGAHAGGYDGGYAGGKGPYAGPFGAHAGGDGYAGGKGHSDSESPHVSPHGYAGKGSFDSTSPLDKENQNGHAKNLPGNENLPAKENLLANENPATKQDLLANENPAANENLPANEVPAVGSIDANKVAVVGSTVANEVPAVGSTAANEVPAVGSTAGHAENLPAGDAENAVNITENLPAGDAGNAEKITENLPTGDAKQTENGDQNAGREDVKKNVIDLYRMLSFISKKVFTSLSN